jgi:hypothetical protein
MVKKRRETSKVLVFVISAYFFGILTLAVIVWLVSNRVMPSEIFFATAGPFASVTGFYLIKSGWEGSALRSSNNYDPYYDARQSCPPYQQNQAPIGIKRGEY